MKTNIIRADRSIFMTSATSLFDEKLSLDAKYLMVCVDYLCESAKKDGLDLDDLYNITKNNLTQSEVNAALNELDEYISRDWFGGQTK